MPLPPARPPATSTWTGYASEWIVSAAALRDAFVRLPALPAAFWCTGACIIALIVASRVLRMRALVRGAAPAPRQVFDIVRRAARRIELAAPPEIRMTDAEVPPMVWCARRPVLVLPRRLWSQLDDASRLAVIFHELAHLRRRDHILCWLEMLSAILFWWNPAVWWVCHQVRDEADACCDAWVVRLQPTGRRAYAQALLASTNMSGTVALAGPVVGLGALRPRTRRLARRLTMVMTEPLRPGLSLRGLCAVAALGVAACLVAPIAACPPEEEAARTKAEELAAAAAELQAHAANAASTYEQFVRDRETMDEAALYEEALDAYTVAAAQDPFRADNDVNARLDALEARLDHIAALLEHLGMAGAAAPNQALGSSYPLAEPRELDTTVGGDDVITRTYALPESKLKELTELMILQDVPILVTPRVEEGVIDVHATPGQHEIFSAFLSIIHPDGVKAKEKSSAHPKERETHEQLKTHDGELRQKKEQLSAELQAAKERAGGHGSHAKDLEAALEQLECELEALEEKAEAASGEEKKAINEHAKTLKQQMKQFEQALREQERQQEKAESDADDLEASLDALDEELEDLEDLADADEAIGRTR